MSDVLTQLESTLMQRKSADGDESYVASLYGKGLDAILKKIAEESAETLMAAKDGDAGAIVYETADLWFHCMVLLAHQNIPLNAVLQELQRRSGTSGHDEKAARKKGA